MTTPPIQTQKQTIQRKYQDPAKTLFQRRNIRPELRYDSSQHPAQALKYFGKKVRIIKKSSDFPHALNLSKYFINAELSDFYLASYSLKSKGSKALCLEYTRVAPFQIKRMFMACKGKVRIEQTQDFSEEFFFRLTRLYMTQVKEINFDWIYCNKINFGSRILASLRRLEKLTISTENGIPTGADENHKISDDYEASNWIRLMESIIKLPSLKTLHFNIYGVEMPADLISSLTLLVANSKIEDWYIDVIIPVNCLENTNTLKLALEKIHTLGIFTNSKSYYGSSKVMKAQNQHEKSKILSLYLQDTDDTENSRVNLYSILRHCTSLKSFILGSNGSDAIYTEENFSFLLKGQPRVYRRALTKESEWARNLYSVVLYYPFDNVSLDKESPIMDLLRKIREESHNIKIMDVFNSRDWLLHKNNQKLLNFESYHLICDKIAGIKSLDNVKISVQTIHLQYLEKLLLSAQNLTILRLKLSHPNTRNYWDDDLPFAHFKNLKELKISFQSLMDEGIWGDHLAHQILELKNLQVFSIKTENNWKMLLTKFCIFINNAVMLPNLKVLRLKTQIVQALNNSSNEKSRHLNLLEEVHEALKIMVYTRKNIESYQIEKLQGFEVKRLEFNRFHIS